MPRWQIFAWLAFDVVVLLAFLAVLFLTTRSFS